MASQPAYAVGPPQPAPGAVQGQPMPAAAGAGGQFAPPMAGMPGQVAVMVHTDFMAAIRGFRGVFLAQNIELLEAVTGCETPNSYRIYNWDPERGREDPKAGRDMMPLAVATEKSNCCERIFCRAARAFDMDIRLMQPAGVSVPQGPAVTMHRPYMCTFLCLNRPVIHIYYGDYAIATVRNPFSICNHILDVSKPTEEEAGKPVHPEVAALPTDHWYRLNAFCLQPAAFCTCPCGPCKEFVFEIFNPADPDKLIGTMKKVWSGCIKEAVTDADNYTIEFPGDASPVQKAALCGAALIADFLLFEDNNQKDNNDNR